MISRVRFVVPPAQLAVQSAHFVHFVNSQLHGIPVSQSLFSFNVGHATPPLAFLLRTLREWVSYPVPHGSLHCVQSAQSETTQLIAEGHVRWEQVAVSSVALQVLPSLASFVISRVRVVVPPPQLAEQLDHFVHPVNSQVHGFISQSLRSSNVGHSTPP